MPVIYCESMNSTRGFFTYLQLRHLSVIYCRSVSYNVDR